MRFLQAHRRAYHNIQRKFLSFRLHRHSGPCWASEVPLSHLSRLHSEPQHYARASNALAAWKGQNYPISSLKHVPSRGEHFVVPEAATPASVSDHTHAQDNIWKWWLRLQPQDESPLSLSIACGQLPFKSAAWWDSLGQYWSFALGGLITRFLWSACRWRPTKLRLLTLTVHLWLRKCGKGRRSL